jgi:hypothetical protein
MTDVKHPLPPRSSFSSSNVRVTDIFKTLGHDGCSTPEAAWNNWYNSIKVGWARDMIQRFARLVIDY